MLQEILSQSSFFLLLAVRSLGMLFTLPLFSMRTLPRASRFALAFYIAYLMLPAADYSAYSSFVSLDGTFSLYYILLLVGEGMIGVIMGFYVSIIFAAFSTAGQFFAFQMGFSAASAYDALSQVENPLIGQFLNLVSMLIFMQSEWFQKLFIRGLMGSISSLNCFELVAAREKIVTFLLKGLTNLFADAMLIALPIMGTLLLVTVCTGLLSKAAPQMNLLSEGFPIMILLSFGIFAIFFRDLCDFFIRSFNTGINDLNSIIHAIGNAASGGVR